MVQVRKYNPEFTLKPFLPIFIILVVFFFATVFISLTAGLTVISIVFIGFALFSLFAFLKLRNIAYLAAFIFQSLMAIFNLTLPMGLIPIGVQEAYFFYFCGLLAAIWLVSLMITQKGKWKGRNIFELAAINIDETVNGYTERPRPAGKSEFSKSELFGFAEYLKRNLIAISYVEKDCIVFVPVKMGDEYPFIFGLAGDYRYYSWIAFGFDGNVSSSLSKKDYLAYREEFSFDQLCDSLGRIFIEFMEYYKKDESERIGHRLRSVKVGIMS